MSLLGHVVVEAVAHLDGYPVGRFREQAHALLAAGVESVARPARRLDGLLQPGKLSLGVLVVPEHLRLGALVGSLLLLDPVHRPRMLALELVHGPLLRALVEVSSRGVAVAALLGHLEGSRDLDGERVLLRRLVRQPRLHVIDPVRARLDHIFGGVRSYRVRLVFVL